jgi:hypothetical protein
LPFAQIGRHLDQDLNVQVAFAETFQVRDALAPQREDLAALRTRGERHLLGGMQRGNFNVRAQGGLGKGDRDLADKVIPLAFEKGVRFDMQDHIKVALTAPALPCPPFAGDPLTASRVYPGRDLDGDLLFSFHAAGAAAFFAWVGDENPLAPAP